MAIRFLDQHGLKSGSQAATNKSDEMMSGADSFPLILLHMFFPP